MGVKLKIKMARTVDVKLKVPDINRKTFKIVFLAHFALTAFAMMSWGPGGYLFTNLLFLGCFIWSLSQPTSAEPVSIGLAINLFCIIFDIVIIGIYFPRYFKGAGKVVFSAVMAIINLLLRFFSSFILYNDWLDRGDIKQEVVPHQQQQGVTVTVTDQNKLSKKMFVK